ncbi:MAG: hypothetical protein M1814_001626 [Vezdaea aestivalis]|nr:MAG: hypothetical protein M1814_001626 [Vezdaea aestivalis]
MPTEQPLKSILKAPSTESTLPAEDQNTQTALHHARLIQHQKEVEALIVQDVEALMDLPSENTLDPAEPSHEDVIHFKKLVVCFQPTDFDAVVEERNIQDQCGYPLCPRKRKHLKSTGKFRIVMHGTDAAVVPRGNLEKWCSNDCAERAMFVKVQLEKEPAWLRPEVSPDKIKLLKELEEPERMEDVRHDIGPQSLSIRLMNLTIDSSKS